MTINVEYRADLDKRRAKLILGSVTLEPGDNQVSIEQLEILERFDYFNKGTENKIFIYTKPEPVKASETVKEQIKQPETVKASETVKEQIKQPETVKEPTKTVKPKATSLSSLTVDDEV